MPNSGQASVFAGLICNVVSCVCSASTESCAGQISKSWLDVVEDAGFSADMSWVLAAGFVSETENTQRSEEHILIYFTSHIIKIWKKNKKMKSI